MKFYRVVLRLSMIMATLFLILNRAFTKAR
uniref:Uncharacterized protein n=1 Tax=Lotus japonicus TaxID=34305 RepID=I3SF87_LOTJA|nr:unknown [Lotus japonicus]